MSIEIDLDNISTAKIKVVGVGGGGGNAINRMINSNLKGVEYIAVNTDSQALNANQASERIQLGATLTKGLGAGSKPEIGRQAVEETREKIMDSLNGADMVFITAGMGGGTGTGASPGIAEIAKQAGALTVGIVTTPFNFEGKPRMTDALTGIENLKKVVDTLIVIPNQKLLAMADRKVPFNETFKIADDILLQATKGISDIINKSTIINVDFKDVSTVMEMKGDALMGTGVAKGEDCGREAAANAINSPLLEEASIKGSRGVLFNISGGAGLSLWDIDQAASLIQEEVGDEARIIVGAGNDDELEDDEIKVTIIATGFNTVEEVAIEDEAVEDDDIARFIQRSEPDADILNKVHEFAGYQCNEQEQHVIKDGFFSTQEQDRRPAFVRHALD